MRKFLKIMITFLAVISILITQFTLPIINDSDSVIVQASNNTPIVFTGTLGGNSVTVDFTNVVTSSSGDGYIKIGDGFKYSGLGSGQGLLIIQIGSRSVPAYSPNYSSVLEEDFEKIKNGQTYAIEATLTSDNYVDSYHYTGVLMRTVFGNSCSHQPDKTPTVFTGNLGGNSVTVDFTNVVTSSSGDGYIKIGNGFKYYGLGNDQGLLVILIGSRSVLAYSPNYSSVLEEDFEKIKNGQTYILESTLTSDNYVDSYHYTGALMKVSFTIPPCQPEPQPGENYGCPIGTIGSLNPLEYRSNLPNNGNARLTIGPDSVTFGSYGNGSLQDATWHQTTSYGILREGPLPVDFYTMLKDMEYIDVIMVSGYISNYGHTQASLEKVAGGGIRCDVPQQPKEEVSLKCPEGYTIKWNASKTSAECEGGSDDNKPKGVVCPPNTVPKPTSINPTYCLSEVPGPPVQGGDPVSTGGEGDIIYPQMPPVNLGIDLNQIINKLTQIDFGDGNNSVTNISINSGDGNNNKINLSLNNYEDNFVNFTNVPNDGKILSLAEKEFKIKNSDGTETKVNGWKPEYIVTYTGGQIVQPKPTNSVLAGQHDRTLSTFRSPPSPAAPSNVEVVLFKIKSLQQLNDLTKNEASLIKVFDNNSDQTYFYKDQISWSSVTNSGTNNYEYLGTNEEGYFLLATKYVDCTNGASSCKTNYTYKAIELSFLNTAGYLPLTNNLNGQVNNIFMTLGSKKSDHGFSNLEYKGPETTYKSLKVPSAYNYKFNYSLIGSTNGGVTLLDKDLKPLTLNGVGVNISSLTVNTVEEVLDGFFIGCDQGIFFVDAQTKQVTKTSVTSPVNDLSIVNDLVYSLSDDELTLHYIIGRDLLKTNVNYSLVGAYSSPSKKAGRIDLLNGLISVASKDQGIESEIIVLESL